MRKILILISMVTVLIITATIIRNPYMRFHRSGDVDIEWTDFIYYNNQLYHLEYGNVDITSQEKEIEESMLDEILGKVKFRLSDNVTSDEYEFREWDASYLRSGTKVYSIKNIEVNKSIAAEKNGRYFIYSVIE